MELQQASPEMVELLRQRLQSGEITSVQEGQVANLTAEAVVDVTDPTTAVTIKEVPKTPGHWSRKP